jgi:hypothetical protein
MAKRTSTVVAGAALTVAAAVAYRRLLREPILTWGATPDEASRRLPGDELLEAADVVSTRAITVGAPASAVWPWLVQMGPGRGGAYTYDWIERLFGIDMHSANQIVPEWQQLDVGDVMRNREGAPGMRLEILEPEHVLAWRSEDGTWVWTFVLVEEDGTTRLISRNRIARGGSLGSRLALLAMEPGSLVMERKMLLGIKQRAERLAGTDLPGTTNGRQPTAAVG